MKKFNLITLIIFLSVFLFSLTVSVHAVPLQTVQGAVFQTKSANIPAQFKTAKGFYIVAEGGGGGEVNANQTAPKGWETFTLIDLNGGQLNSGDSIQIKTDNKKHYWVAIGGGGQNLQANRTVPEEWETFKIIRKNGKGKIAYGDIVYLLSNKGYFVFAENGGGSGLKANQKKPNSWTTFSMVNPGGSTPDLSNVQMQTGTVVSGTSSSDKKEQPKVFMPKLSDILIKTIPVSGTRSSKTETVKKQPDVHMAPIPETVTGGRKPAISGDYKGTPKFVMKPRPPQSGSATENNKPVLPFDKGKSFKILTGTTETKHLISVAEPGLYKVKIHINHDESKFGQLSLYPRIDKEKIKSVDISSDWNAQQQPIHQGIEIYETLTGKKVKRVYAPWIEGDEALQHIAANEYYFWVNKQHLPTSGKLQFRLEILSYVPAQDFSQNIKTSSDDIKGLNIQQAAPQDHPGITGRFEVTYAAPFKPKDFSSIVRLPTEKSSGMMYSVIETPVLQMQNNQGPAEKKPMLTFLIANSTKLSSQTPAQNDGSKEKSDNIKFVEKAHPNDWVYKEVLDQEYGEFVYPKSVSVNSDSVQTKSKIIKWLEWDLAAQDPDFKGLEIIDVNNPAMGVYQLVVGNAPGLGAPALEIFTTTGYLTHYEPVSTKQNEIRIATRHLDVDWVYVAELTDLIVSEQAETNTDDDDAGFGEFTVLTSIILSEALDTDSEQSQLKTDQILAMNGSFPFVDDRYRPQEISIRSPNNGGDDPVINKEPSTTKPRMPIFVMDEKELDKYDDLYLSVTVVEDDDATFWQEYGSMIKAFADLIYTPVKILATGGITAFTDFKSIGEKVFGFAKSTFITTPKVDDFMGTASIIAQKYHHFGLGKNINKASYRADGPHSYQDLDYLPETSGEYIDGESEPTVQASKNKNLDKHRSIETQFVLRRIPKLEGWADIQLLSYTPTYDMNNRYFECFMNRYKQGKNAKPLENCEGKMNHILIEGYESMVWDPCEPGAFNTYRTYEAKDVPPDDNEGIPEIVTVRKPSPPEYTKNHSTGELNPVKCKLNKGVAPSSKWENKGFTYYQSSIFDLPHDGIPVNPTAVISFTLYYNDVVKYANETWGKPQEDQKDNGWVDGVLHLNCTKSPDNPFYEVDITVKDPGDWLKEAKLKAYVYVRDSKI